MVETQGPFEYSPQKTIAGFRDLSSNPISPKELRPTGQGIAVIDISASPRRQLKVSRRESSKTSNGSWPYSGCLLSGSRSSRSILLIDSRPISGDGIPARRYRNESGVTLRVPVMVRHALFSSRLILDAHADLLR